LFFSTDLDLADTFLSQEVDVSIHFCQLLKGFNYLVEELPISCCVRDGFEEIPGGRRFALWLLRGVDPDGLVGKPGRPAPPDGKVFFWQGMTPPLA
jgi:hypothetical protein